MEPTRHDLSQPEEPEFDLYTIPSYSSWFRWDDIHETERSAMREFFDGSSITRTPKIYKEYRDFIINKYREDTSRTLTFTEVRKSLVGDVNLLHKVFQFLNYWDLINFSVAKDSNHGRFDDWDVDVEVLQEEERGKEGGEVRVRVEDGPPMGVRVVESPDSGRHVSIVEKERVEAAGVNIAIGVVRMPALASFSNAFGELGNVKRGGGGVACGSCGGSCDSGRYEYVKSNFQICVKCFEDGNFGQNKLKDNFKLNECIDSKGTSGAVWTEAETLLLLEAVMKHGDDWDLITQNVQTKTKHDCILKLIELPFGALPFYSLYGKSNFSGFNGSMQSSKRVLLSSAVAIKDETNSLKQGPVSSAENEDTEKSKNQSHGITNFEKPNDNEVNEAPPMKRMRIASPLDAGSSLMKEVALRSTMVDPDVTAAAADAAVTAVCYETSCPREIFDDEEDFLTNVLSPKALSGSKRVDQVGYVETAAESESQEAAAVQNDVPLTLQLRTAIGTSLGASAARAKLLADQEDREIENLVALIIETQMKKLHSKLKHFDDLEVIMDKEYVELEKVVESLIKERINVLHKSFNAGILKSKNHASVVKSHGDS